MKKILVVDDSMSVRTQVKGYLDQAGFDVIEAADGQEGWEAVSRRDDIGLVLLDVNMPRMDGLQMLEQVQAEGHLDSLVVVMLTSEGDSSMIERAKRSGAKGWLVKPFRGDALVKTARVALKRTP